MSGPGPALTLGPDHGVVAIVQTLLNYCFAFYALILIKVASMFSVSNEHKRIVIKAISVLLLVLRVDIEQDLDELLECLLVLLPKRIIYRCQYP